MLGRLYRGCLGILLVTMAGMTRGLFELGQFLVPIRLRVMLTWNLLMFWLN